MAMSSDDNFIDLNPIDGQSIWNVNQEPDPFNMTRPFKFHSEEGKQVFPLPGFCIKSKTKKGEEVFMNMCHSEDVPKPDEKLMSPKDVGEDESIRLPLGIGYPHKEKDRSGKDCICIDVLINTELLYSLLRDEDARSFVMSLCIQGIADKYGILIRDDCCRKLAKPYHGSVQKYFVKDTDSQVNPFGVLQGDSSLSTSLIGSMGSSIGDTIAAVNSADQSVRPKYSLLNRNPSEKSEKEEEEESFQEKAAAAMNELYLSVMNDPILSMLPKKKVEYGFYLLPAYGSDPMRYVLEINFQYSLLDSHKQVKVFLSCDRIIVNEKLRKFNLDLSLPNPVNTKLCRANLAKGILTVSLPLDRQNEDI